MSTDQQVDAGTPRRFHLPHTHLELAFGNDWFGKKAEDFARFFGTPTFLIGQTIIVAIWILLNAIGWTQFDVYPFILLNLAFSTQAAYAAPLILLAQTRQSDRDKAMSIADAQHREELHQISETRQAQMREQSAMLIEMMRAEHRAHRAGGNPAHAKHRAHGNDQDPRRTDRRRDRRGPHLRRSARARLSWIGREASALAARPRPSGYLSMYSMVCSSAAGETLNSPV